MDNDEKREFEERIIELEKENQKIKKEIKDIEDGFFKYYYTIQLWTNAGFFDYVKKRTVAQMFEDIIWGDMMKRLDARLKFVKSFYSND